MSEEEILLLTLTTFSGRTRSRLATTDHALPIQTFHRKNKINVTKSQWREKKIHLSLLVQSLRACLKEIRILKVALQQCFCKQRHWHFFDTRFLKYSCFTTVLAHLSLHQCKSLFKCVAISVMSVYVCLWCVTCLYYKYGKRDYVLMQVSVYP